MKYFFISFLIFFSFIQTVFSQDTIVVDKIIARVGDKIILQSDIEKEYLQYLSERIPVTENTKCQILEGQLLQKLLLSQAEIDSVIVTNADVASEVDARLEYFINMAGGPVALEKELNKGIYQIKEDLMETIREQYTIQQMQSQLTSNVTITPSEVNDYFSTLNKDSLPIIDESFEIQRIYIIPKPTNAANQEAIAQLNEWREEIVNGEKRFQTIALINSEDLSTKPNGGKLPEMTSDQLDPDFAAAAFDLDINEVSQVVKSQFGYHLIELLERNGDRVVLRHILKKPEITQTQLNAAKRKLDSIVNLINIDTLTFDDAANRYSDDEQTNRNGGLVYSQATGRAIIEYSELSASLKTIVDQLEIGEISDVIETVDQTGNTIYAVYLVKSKTPKHNANPSQDYQMLHDMALENKKQVKLKEWMNSVIKNFYVHIDDKYDNCDFEANWLN